MLSRAINQNRHVFEIFNARLASRRPNSSVSPSCARNARAMKSRKEPQLLSHVLQALTDFKAGTTLKKITDRVQTAVNLSKVRPRPRNLAGQVRRALRHGVQTGVFKHRSGRFRLATTNEINQALKLGYVSAKRRRGKRAPRKKRKRSPSRRASMRLSPRERARLRRFSFILMLLSKDLASVLDGNNSMT